MEKDLIFESFRNCVSDQKCKGCEWKACKVAQYRKVGIPLDLAFAVISLMADLLKEQEAKQAIKLTYCVMMNRDYENPICVTRYEWLCPTCKSLLCRDIDVIDDNYHFCKVCGQAVKWND